MTKKLTTNDFLLIFQELENLYVQELKFNIGTSVKLFKLYKEADEINSYILNRIKTVIPNIGEKGYVLTEDEKSIYNALLLSPIEIETYGLTINELTESLDAKITLSGVEKILKLL